MQISNESYSYKQIIPHNGVQTVTITTSGGQETIFRIPVDVFNLSKTDLRFTVTGVALLANSNWFINDCLTPIRYMQLYTANSVYLADLSEVANMTKVLWKVEIPFDEYITYDRFFNNTGNGRYLRASNSIANSTSSTALAPYARRYNGTAADVNYLEPKYLEPGTIAANEPIFNITIPLGMMKDTIFELDKDLYLGEVLYLKLIWNSSTRIAFNSTDITDPTAGRAILGANINISNLALYLAMEKNPEINNEIRAKVYAGGFKILIPYVYTSKTNLTGSSQTVTQRYNRTHGIRLKKIFHSVFNNIETSYTSYDNSNVTGFVKTQVFYTAINDQRLQNYNLVTASNDDYVLMKEFLNRSVIQSSDMYNYNWVWLENFSNRHNLESGLDLSISQKWDFYGITMTNATYNHYTFAITQKMLTISSSGITVI